MKECAFCDRQGKLSREHIVSGWMEKLFPGKLRVNYTNHLGQTYQRKAKKINWRERVVCEPCNNTWLSNIEVKHAQPVMTPLITGKMGIPIGLAEAHSLALFAFKTAAVLNYSNPRGGEYFFSREERHEFKNSQTIPRRIQMWLAPVPNHRGSGRFITLYHQGQISASERLEMYVCTFAIGNLAVQVVAAKEISIIIDPSPGFEGLAVPFWPGMWPDYIWPGDKLGAGFINGKEHFEAFASRWHNITITQ